MLAMLLQSGPLALAKRSCGVKIIPADLLWSSWRLLGVVSPGKMVDRKVILKNLGILCQRVLWLV